MIKSTSYIFQVDGKMYDGVKYFRILHQNEEFNWLHKLISLSITHHLENDYKHSKFIEKSLLVKKEMRRLPSISYIKVVRSNQKKILEYLLFIPKVETLRQCLHRTKKIPHMWFNNHGNTVRTNNNFMQKLTEVFQPA